MHKADLITMFNYYYWANARILACAGRLQPGQFTVTRQTSHGSIRGALLHMLNVERNWRSVTLEGGGRPARIPEEEIPDVAALTARWHVEEQTTRGLLDALPDGSLDISKQVTDRSGKTHEWLLWQPLYQVLNHATQHRSEAAMLLTEYNQSPGDLDFIFFLMDQTAH
jgi:uncharacterized damage-inducible protein DinB